MLWGEILLYFYVPMFLQKDFFRWDRSGKFEKTRKKKWRKEKEEIFIYLFAYMEVPILMRTHSDGNLPYTIGPFREIWCNFLHPFFFLCLSLLFFFFLPIL
jgi:hypothetical protein